MESRNLILAIILSVGVLFIWSFFFEAPEQEILNGELEMIINPLQEEHQLNLMSKITE